METGCFTSISVSFGTGVSDQKWDYYASITFVLCIFILANYSTTIPKNETPLKEVQIQLAKYEDVKEAMMSALKEVTGKGLK
jgi:hypothetical protein